jgi:hypothetical protein
VPAAGFFLKVGRTAAIKVNILSNYDHTLINNAYVTLSQSNIIFVLKADLILSRCVPEELSDPYMRGGDVDFRPATQGKMRTFNPQRTHFRAHLSILTQKRGSQKLANPLFLLVRPAAFEPSEGGSRLHST